MGLHWDRLQLVTFSAGSATLWCRGNDPSRRILCAGGFFLASPGWYGGEVSVGGLAIGQIFPPAGFVAVAPGLSLLRTWNGPPRAASGATYWGPRVRLVALPIGISVGWYWRIGDTTGTFDRIWTVSVGVGMP